LEKTHKLKKIILAGFYLNVAYGIGFDFGGEGKRIAVQFKKDATLKETAEILEQAAIKIKSLSKDEVLNE